MDDSSEVKNYHENPQRKIGKKNIRNWEKVQPGNNSKKRKPFPWRDTITADHGKKENFNHKIPPGIQMPPIRELQ